jgi:hypothetical protein
MYFKEESEKEYPHTKRDLYELDSSDGRSRQTFTSAQNSSSSRWRFQERYGVREIMSQR